MRRGMEDHAGRQRVMPPRQLDVKIFLFDFQGVQIFLEHQIVHLLKLLEVTAHGLEAAAPPGSAVSSAAKAAATASARFTPVSAAGPTANGFASPDIFRTGMRHRFAGEVNPALIIYIEDFHLE